MNAQRSLIPEEQALNRAQLHAIQRKKLQALLREILPSNPFYQRKLQGLKFDPLRDRLENLPFTTRREIEQDQAEHPPYGSNHTYPLSRYCRFHQTSGSGGRPVRWLDTAESWEWIKGCWQRIYDAAKITPDDRFLFPFSFGPFLGFWAAFDSAVSRGNLCIAAGGLSTGARLKLILDNQVTVLGCTPTYALRLAEVAQEEGIDIAGSAVRALIVAGEPGGHIPATRRRIEAAWNARVFDHTGMTEIGSLGIECQENPEAVHLLETECIVEAIDPATLEPVGEGEVGELVITNLGRLGSPLIRYRTGDQVRLGHGRCACGRHLVRMEGGILGRIDDMFIVRGNNVFPSALEAVIRRFGEVAEFRVSVRTDSALIQAEIEIEPFGEVSGSRNPTPSQPSPAEYHGGGKEERAGGGGDLAGRIAQAVQAALNFRPEVRLVPPGTLPRFEMKARRFIRQAGPEKTEVKV